MSVEQAVVRAFAFQGNPVRIELFDGEPWWVAKDVALALGYAEGSDINSLTSKVPDEWKGRKPFGTLGGVQEIIALSEHGLYFFLARSDKPAALPFQKWLAGEVLPSIRKTGSYVAPGAPAPIDFTDPRAAALAFVEQYDRAMVAEARVQRLTQIQEHAAPFVSFAASVMASPTTYYVGQVAKAITQGTGKRLGQNTFFAWLRKENFLHKRVPRRNEPTQRSIEQRLFVIVEYVHETDEGEKIINRTTRITGKGRLYFYSRFYAMAIMEGLEPLSAPPEVGYSLEEGDLEADREAAIIVASEAIPQEA